MLTIQKEMKFHGEEPRNNSKIYYFYTRALHTLMQSGVKIVERRWWYTNISPNFLSFFLSSFDVSMSPDVRGNEFLKFFSLFFLKHLSLGIKKKFTFENLLRNFLHLFSIIIFADSKLLRLVQGLGFIFRFIFWTFTVAPCNISNRISFTLFSYTRNFVRAIPFRGKGREERGGGGEEGV